MRSANGLTMVNVRQFIAEGVHYILWKVKKVAVSYKMLLHLIEVNLYNKIFDSIKIQ